MPRRTAVMGSLTDTKFTSAYNELGPVTLAKSLGISLGAVGSRASRLRKENPTTGPSYRSHIELKGITDEDFIREYTRIGPTALGKVMNIPRKTIAARATYLRKTTGQLIDTGKKSPQITSGTDHANYPGRIQLDMPDGVALIGGDMHYWPAPKPSVMHRAFVKLAHELAPKLVCLNGDVVDMAGVSRHPPIGWEDMPTVQQELEYAQERLAEILNALTKKTQKTWNLGNHDARFETRLADRNPQYAKVKGIHLSDHFPEWERAWSTFINDTVAIKHRFKGGAHAPYNNAVYSGLTMVTGHLHSAKVTPFTDYRGTRWGVDHGTMADIWGPQFTNYTEDAPRNWVSGFCVLTFLKGRLLWPELVTKFDDNHVEFRGKVIKV